MPKLWERIAACVACSWPVADSVHLLLKWVRTVLLHQVCQTEVNLGQAGCPCAPILCHHVRSSSAKFTRAQRKSSKRCRRTPVLSTALRERLRTRRDIDGSLTMDLFLILCCGYCTLCQVRIWKVANIRVVQSHTVSASLSVDEPMKSSKRPNVALRCVLENQTCTCVLDDSFVYRRRRRYEPCKKDGWHQTQRSWKSRGSELLSAHSEKSQAFLSQIGNNLVGKTSAFCACRH